MSDSRRLVDKLWSYCNVLRDDGVGVIEYTEQLRTCCSSRWRTNAPPGG
ncbi:hypothetical protein HJG43_02630 [Kineosporiaceae bacterium SCSIO 59966]|nr:hypothetical protein HJG43_02630 [Kineosporiaceae bacterium SCSIO 59966]